MKTIDIYDFRDEEHKPEKPFQKINYSLIGDLLKKHGIVQKSFGLCAEPFERYFEQGHLNKRGVSSARGEINCIYADINHNFTYKRYTLFSHIEIIQMDGEYYVCCLAQESHYKKNIRGTKEKVFVCHEEELEMVIDEIFQTNENIRKEVLK